MSNGIVAIDRRDLQRQLGAQLHAALRDDVKVEISFLITFKVDDETFVNAVIDPYQAFPRWQAKQLVQGALNKLNEIDRDSNAPQDISLVEVAEAGLQVGVAE